MDTLSVGFTIVTYAIIRAFITSFIIGLVTYLLCLPACFVG
ncbi:hypothetical protein [Bulleidia sp. zg-1006]|nr:hypothetical protein JOS54_02445 [Bulleidia sp. zg-1006]